MSLSVNQHNYDIYYKLDDAKVSIISGGSNFSLVSDISKLLGININNTTKYFSNTEIRPLICKSITGKTVYIIQTGCAYNNKSINDYLIELYLYIRTCKRSDAARIVVVMPLYPYSRQDKKDKPRAAISASDIGFLLETAGANRIITYDLHNPAIQGFHSIPVDNLPCNKFIIDYLQKIIKDKSQYTLVSPDAGCLPRIKKYARILGLPMVYFSKERDYTKENTISESVIIGDHKKYVKDKHMIFIDDMADTCGTLCKTCKLLKEKGAIDVIVGVTHGIFSGDALDKINSNDDIKIIITSDSLPQKENMEKCLKILTYSLAESIAEVITRLEFNKSISEMSLFQY